MMRKLSWIFLLLLTMSLWGQEENQEPVVTNPIAKQLDYEHVLISYDVEDGDGDLIQSTGVLGLPPMPRLMRVGPPSFSALANGVTILPDPSLPGQDGYRIEIDPVLSNMNLVPLWDSLAGNNNSRTRRVVIRTPFGTAIAPPSEWLLIEAVIP